jgi:steroid delta-isomerase-like uncharacterized protein
MHILYANLVKDEDLSPERRAFLKTLGATAVTAAAVPCAATLADAPGSGPMNFDTAQNWITAFFKKGAEEVLSYYADDFVWEDIEFFQTITTKADLYKAFVVFNNSGADSPFGVHKFDVVRYDGGPAGASKAVKRKEGVPEGWQSDEYHRLADKIQLGSKLDYDEWGYIQWVWIAKHNQDFMGMPAKGKTTTTRGVTFQCYKNRKIVRCQTFWNFREFAVQLGVVPPPDEGWRKNKGLPNKS